MIRASFCAFRFIAAFILAAVLLTGLLSGCSSGDSDTSGGKSEAAVSDGAQMADSKEAPGEFIQAGSGEAEAADEAAAGLAGGSDSSPDPFGQKIIYSASLTMEVDKVETAATELRNVIHQSGAYILQFQTTKQDGEFGAVYTIKVPADGFMSFIDRIGKIENGQLLETDVLGKDVSEEYVDTESRLKAKQMVESRLLAMMESATNADALLKFSDQLAVVQEEIEQLKGRLRYLDHHVAYSTVELRLYQTGQETLLKKNDKSLGGKIAGALKGSTEAVWAGLQLLLVIVAGALPVLAALAVIAVPVLWYVKRGRKRAGKKEALPPDEDGEEPPVL